MSLESSGEAVTADRSALGLIGLMLAAATLVVMVTAAVAVSDYRGGEAFSAPQAAATAATASR
jgi:hypothetical protein